MLIIKINGSIFYFQTSQINFTHESFSDNMHSLARYGASYGYIELLSPSPVAYILRAISQRETYAVSYRTSEMDEGEIIVQPLYKKLLYSFLFTTLRILKILKKFSLTSMKKLGLPFAFLRLSTCHVQFLGFYGCYVMIMSRKMPSQSWELTF